MTVLSQPTLPIGTIVDDLHIRGVLGLGAYGQVYLGYHPHTRNHFAVKSLPQTGLDNRQRAFQRAEIRLHASLFHPNIIQLKRIIRSPEWTHVVLEYGPEGDLFSAITEDNLYYGNHDLIRRVFLQLIDAVSYCHTQNVYHRDLKPENILVFDGGCTVKLADFGLATTNAYSTDYGCGSTFYFSPECQGETRQPTGYATSPNDVWSLGIVLINLATGRNPWHQATHKDPTFREFLRDPDYLYKILPISKRLNQILKRVFCLDPQRRITLHELREKIKSCPHFTRTPQVEKFESAEMNKKPSPIKVDMGLIPLPLSPPVTPCLSSRSSSAADSPSAFPPTPTDVLGPDKGPLNATAPCTTSAQHICKSKRAVDPDALYGTPSVLLDTH